jgi:hypothetical protein
LTGTRWQPDLPFTARLISGVNRRDNVSGLAEVTRMRRKIFAFTGSICLLMAVAGPAPAASPVTACDRQPVMQVDSARVSVEPDGHFVQVFGVAESAGWSRPTLIVSQQAGQTATVEFVACRPEMSAQVLTPLQAEVTLDLPPDTGTLVIKARTNSMTIEINAR